ncbi:MAG: hypothetical protein KAX23_04210 [Dehalococcoidia bacterium]|nr:hypothetical protein [Chloroflexota bacterium]MCK4242732.1 hypothetical protein [Dehalococcoidia bacterium]
MPVIRIDDEVWGRLQEAAEPLVDTPNSVLRRLLELEKEEDATERVIEIQVKSLYTPRRWALIPIPKDRRRFLPGYKVNFDLLTDVGVISTHVTSAPKGTPIGDLNAGAYIQGGLRQWYQEHPELKDGDKLRIEALEPGKRYRLSIAQG